MTDRLMMLAKRGDLHGAGWAFARHPRMMPWVAKLFDTLGPRDPHRVRLRYACAKGAFGYGDAAPTAVIELVDVTDAKGSTGPRRIRTTRRERPPPKKAAQRQKVIFCRSLPLLLLDLLWRWPLHRRLLDARDAASKMPSMALCSSLALFAWKFAVQRSSTRSGSSSRADRQARW